MRRDQFDDDAIQQTHCIRITTTSCFGKVTVSCRSGAYAQVCPGLVDFLAAATERIAGIFKVIYHKRQSSLLTAT
jgi:hypothetical protein